MAKQIGPDRPIWPPVPEPDAPQPHAAALVPPFRDAARIHLQRCILLQETFTSSVKLIAKSAELH